MSIQGVSIDLGSIADADQVASVLRGLTAGGPFVLARVERDGDLNRCVFDLKRADVVVGYRSVIELQWRVAREFEIVRVEGHEVVLSVPKDGIS